MSFGKHIFVVPHSSSDVFEQRASNTMFNTTTGFFIIFALLTLKILRLLTHSEPLPGVPRLEGLPSTILGALYIGLRHGVPSLINRIVTVGGDALSYVTIGGTVIVCIQEPTLVREMLSLPPEIASREGDLDHTLMSPWSALRRLIGKSLFTDIGPNVALHRKAFSRELNSTGALAEKFVMINRLAAKHMHALSPDRSTAEITDVERVVDDFSIDVWGTLLYGNPEFSTNEDVWKTSENVKKNIVTSTVGYALQILLRMRCPGSLSKAEMQSQKDIANIVEKNCKVLEENEKVDDAAPGLLRRLSMMTGGERRGPLSDFAHEVANFNIFGGQTYIGGLVSFALLTCAKHPESFRRMTTEVESLKTLGFAAVNSQTPYLDAVFSELLRLYPQAITYYRVVNREVTLKSWTRPVTLKPGMILVTSLPHLHKSEKHWGSDVNEFRPERFLDGSAKSIRAAYMPVGYGPRSCVAYKFALLMAKTFMVVLLRSYHVEVDNQDNEIVIGPSAVHETTKPVAVRLSRR